MKNTLVAALFGLSLLACQKESSAPAPTAVNSSTPTPSRTAAAEVAPERVAPMHPTPAAPAAPAAAAPIAHGKLPWFQGSFDALVAEATRTKKIVFLDFWTSWCGWCKRLDKDTFSDDTVVEAMKDVLCYSVDAESESGAPIAQKFGAKSYPTLVFLNSDGTERDRIMGYLAPKEFIAEVQRIARNEGTLADLAARVEKSPKDLFARLDFARKLAGKQDAPAVEKQVTEALTLIERGEGFDTQSVDERWKIAQRLGELGHQGGMQDQLKAIELLDPEGTSYVRRRLRFEEVKNAVEQSYVQTQTLDTQPLRDFAEQEKHGDIAFLTWGTVFDFERNVAEQARNRENLAEEKTRKATSREALRRAWERRPAGTDGRWGVFFASIYYQDSDVTTDDEKQLAIEMAQKALDATPDSADHFDMLACSYFVAGRRDDALAAIDKGLAVKPDSEALKQRKSEFSKEN